MTRIAPVLPCSLVVLLTISCAGPPSRSPEPQLRGHDEATPKPISPGDSDELERLQALGYLDTSGIPKLGPGSGITVMDPEASYVGDSLVVFANPCRVELLGPSGQILRSWSDPHSRIWHDAVLLANGDLVVVGSTVDPTTADDPIRDGRYLQRLGPDGTVIWRTDIAAHHDVEVIPGGRLLTLVMERRSIPELDPDHDVIDDRLTLLSLDGQVIESLSVYEALAASSPPFELRMTALSDGAGSPFRDPLHCNAARWSDGSGGAAGSPAHAPDTVLVTSRHQDAIFAIDWRTRRLVWSWGPGVLSGPHAASPLANGNILVFDNGLSRGWSRVLEVDPRDPTSARQFASKGARLFSRVMGDCQRLPNGNTLFVHTEGGVAVELTANGRAVWRYEATRSMSTGHRAKIARLERLPPTRGE
jgi:hypothetical protein